MGVESGKVTHEHIYWDQRSLLAQIGVFDPAKLPVPGAEQARKLLNPKLPSNELIHRAERTKT
jgi:carboxymethylenebutenolidase